MSFFTDHSNVICVIGALIKGKQHQHVTCQLTKFNTQTSFFVLINSNNLNKHLKTHGQEKELPKSMESEMEKLMNTVIMTQQD